MLVRLIVGSIINIAVFILLYSAKILGFIAYPVLSPIVCTLVGYKITKKLWFGFVSFSSIQILYIGFYETVRNMSLNRTFLEQFRYDYLLGVEGRWYLIVHVIALFFSFITTLIIFKKAFTK